MLRIALLLLGISILTALVIKRFVVLPQTAVSQKKAPCTVLNLYRALLGKQLNFQTGKKLHLVNNTLTLPSREAVAADYGSLAEAVINAGLIVASQYRLRWIKHLDSLLLSCKIVPAFTLLGAIFGGIAGTLPFAVTLLVVSLGAFYASFTLLCVCYVRWSASRLLHSKALQFLRSKGVRDEEILTRVMRSRPYFILQNYPF